MDDELVKVTLYTWERDVVNRNILGLNMDPLGDGGRGVGELNMSSDVSFSFPCHPRYINGL